MAVTVADKALWGYGPWQHEPDEASWTDSETGYSCRARRGPQGEWWATVRLPDGHRWRKDPPPLDGDESPFALLDVHGGVMDCYVVGGGVGEGGAVFAAIGIAEVEFMCGHGGDYKPASLEGPDEFTVYRILTFVQSECARLARQLQAVT